ncbi:MAG: hypothetical protein IRZ16_07720 [Myxococcaceae bacterium]|nr:hypothetical protein [Myxococcaceae bacterium]
MRKFHQRYLRGRHSIGLLVAVAEAGLYRSTHGRWPTRSEVIEAAAGAVPPGMTVTVEAEGLVLGLPDDGIHGAVVVKASSEAAR